LTIPADISTILIPRFDTLGDIVLLEGFLEAVIERFPNAEITMLVREGYDQLAPLFPAKINWLTTSLYPYNGFQESDFTKIEALLEQLSHEPWDLVFFTTYNRTWIDDILAAKLAGTCRIAIGETRKAEVWFNRLLKRLNLKDELPFDSVVWVDEKDREVEKYQRLWTALFSEDTLPLPRLGVPEDCSVQADAVLNLLGIAGQKYFVCAPAGTQNIAIKTWPADRFAEVIMWVYQHCGLHPLLVGHQSESEEIAAVGDLLERAGIAWSLWLGKTGEVPLLSALLNKSQIYVGNDTGTMHIAAAVNIPVVGIFGGGTFPRFLPVGAHSLGVAGELPCFGCGWDCLFGTAPCIRLVSTVDVQTAIVRVYEELSESNLQLSLSMVSNEILSCIKHVHAKCKLIEMDRAARLEIIQKLQSQYNKDLLAWEADSAAKLAIIESKDRDFKKKLDVVEADRAARLVIIQELESQLNQVSTDSAARLEVILSLDAQLKESEADRVARLNVINSLEAQLIEIKKNLRSATDVLSKITSSKIYSFLTKLHIHL